jgi:CRISPR/Cas system-associated exonuclease Cas4 (RecB family)
MDLIKRLHEAATQQKQAWPTFSGGNLDRSQYLTSSENLSCLRKLKLDKMEGRGLESWGYAERGHAVEAWVVDMLEFSLIEGEALNFHAFMQRSFTDETKRLSGTPDGVLVTVKGRRTTRTLLEFKSVDPRTNLEAMDRPKPQHEAQVQQNMYLLNHNKLTVSKALILYVDASNFQRMRQFDVDYDKSAAERFAVRAENLFSNTAEALPAEGLTNNGCTYCAHTEACSRIQLANKAAPPKALAPGAMPEFAPRGITETIRSYAATNEAKKGLEQTLKELGEKIKEHAQQNSETVLRTANHVAYVSEVAGRKTLDVAAYEKATGVPAEDYYKIGKPSLRLEVKPVEE